MNAPFDRKAYLAAVMKPAKAKRAKPKQPERELQAAIVKGIRTQYPSIIVAAIPNGGSRNAIEAANMKRAGGMAGIPDLLVLFPGTKSWPTPHPGHVGFIEVKAGNITASSLSEGQKVFRDYCLEHAIPWICCNSVTSALDWVEAFR